MALISSGVVKGTICPICGTANQTCGLPYQGQPLDVQEATVPDAHDLYIYQDANGNTYQMTAADAKEAGYTRVGGGAVAAADQQREDAGGAEASSPDAPKAAEAAANKARTAEANK